MSSISALPSSTMPLPFAPTFSSSTDIYVPITKNGIYTPKSYFSTKHKLHVSFLSKVPTCISAAQKEEMWRLAYVQEYNALKYVGTWSLVDPTEGQNIVGCKWVFRIKYNPDGTIDRHKLD